MWRNCKKQKRIILGIGLLVFLLFTVKTEFTILTNAKIVMAAEMQASSTDSEENQIQLNCVSNIRQTKATVTSYTVAWTKAKYAEYYYILSEDGKVLKKVNDKTYVTIKAKAGTKNTIYVVSARKLSDGSEIKSVPKKFSNAKTAPGKVGNLGSFKADHITWRTDNDQINISWDKNKADKYYVEGYKLSIYSIDGKKLLKTYTMKKPYKSFKLNSVINKGFQCRVAGYITINGKRCYGKWAKKIVVPAAKMTFQRNGSNSGIVRWTKVQNAVKYTIYICENPFSPIQKRNYKKVGDVSGTYSSYEVNGIKRNTKMGFYVIPTVKIKGKTYKADKSWYTYVKLR